MAPLVPYLAVISAVTSVVSLAMTLSMRPENNEMKDSGSSIDRKGQNNPKVVPFGRCVVPSVRVWNNVNNTNTNWLAQVHSFGVGPILKYEQLYIDGVNYFANSSFATANTWHQGDASGKSGEFPNLDLGLRLGANTETAYSQLFSHSDGEWDASCRGDRTASCSMLVQRLLNKESDNNIRIMSDRFKVEALLHGVAVIDPRFSLSNRTWINSGKESYRNPACVLYTYLVDTYYGMGVPADAVHTQSFIDLANYCDQFGFKFDGYIDQGSDYGQILMDMFSSFDGVAYVEDGQIKVKADKLSPAVAHITEDDMVGSFRLSNSNDGSYYNIVSIEFINADANFTADKYVIPKDVANNATIKADGFEKTKDVKMLYTSDGDKFEQVKKVANKYLRKAKYQQTIEFELDNTLKDIHVYDVIEVTQKDYGLTKKKFRIDKIETSLDDKTTISKVTATEYNESVYDEFNYDDGITSPPIKPPSMKVPSPVGLKFTQKGFTTKGYGLLEWTTRYNREHRTVIEHKLSSASSWSRIGDFEGNDYELSNLAPDSYDFRVMTKTFMGSTSPWTILEKQIVKGGVVLPTPTNGKAVFTTSDCIISWDDMKTKPLVTPDTAVFDGIKTVGDVFSHYEVVVYKGSSHVYKETLSTSSNKFNYTFAMNVASGVNRDLRFEVKVIAKDGSESGKLTIDAFNNQCGQPSGVEVNGELVKLSVRFDAANDADYQASDIHISNVANFTPSASTLVATVIGSTVLNKTYEGVHYLRVGHYDVFGKDQMAYCAPVAFTMKDIDDLLDNSANFSDTLADLEQAANDILEHAEDIKTINTTLGNHQAQITTNKTTITGVQGNLSNLSSTVSSNFNTLNGKITQNATSISNTNKTVSNLSSTVSANYGDLNGKITNTNQVIAGVDGKVEALTQIKHDVNGKVSGLIMGNDGETSTFDVIADKFRISSKAGEQAVFQVNATTGETIIRNALIKNLTATNIAADAITGNHIASNTKIIAGSGTASATLDGQDANWRIYAGHSTPASAPFRVDKTGKLFATNADITGKVTATSGTFSGVNIGNANITGALTVSNGGTGRTRILAGNSTGHAIDVYDNNNPRMVIRHNGQMQMWNNSGQEVINFNPAANSFVFKGTVHADTIVGDLVSAKLFTFGIKNTNGAHVLFATTITNRSGRPAVVVAQPMPMNCYAYARHSGGNGSSSHRAEIAIEYRDGSVNGPVLASSKIVASSYSSTSGGSTDTSGPDSKAVMSTGLGITIPAGGSKHIVCVCRIAGVTTTSTSTSTGAWARLEATQNTMQFFRDGGAFS
ncbi:hypothetical protein V4F87_003255 [Vibrio parahaemolyticus]|nr:hypothetical protein [Vibrio parahaemolyticus]